jgi:hypothetical protein
MHWVEDGGEVANMIFAVEDSCFTPDSDAAPVPVTIAGFEGSYLEPAEPPAPFENVGDATTRAYELTIGAGTLCVYATWHPTTTADQVAATLAIVDSLRAEHHEDGGIRINFTTTARWDTG